MEHVDPGVHDLSAERYMAAEGVSASMLNILAESTPMHLRCWLSGERKIETKALNFGILAHYAILQGDLYKDLFHIRPEGLKFTTKEGKQWKEEHADKPDVTFDESNHLIGMVEAIRGHPMARRLLDTGKPEQSLFAVDDTGTTRKCRLDSLTKGNVIPDVKTCLSASTDFFERQISRLRYHVRAAYYLDLANMLNIDKDYFMFVAVEKTPPYAVRCLRLSGDVVNWGRKCYQADLQTYRNCVENDEWPGYEDSYFEIALPAWEMRQILELI
jgi:PDDEXK-like domain of unknown function (DUF3799)